MTRACIITVSENAESGITLKKIESILIPAGMVGALVYLFHTVIGARMWPEYNPVTTDISTLTANGSPNAEFLRILTTAYGILMILFAIGMIMRAFRVYNGKLKAAMMILLVLQSVSLGGYALFPLDSNAPMNSFQNSMHIVVTAVVVLATAAFAFLAAFGYLNQEGLNKFGKVVLGLAVAIAVFGLFNPIAAAFGLQILGITERLVIFSIMVLLFAISNFETFTITPYNT